MRSLWIAVFLVMISGAAGAQSVVVGLGYADFSYYQSRDTVTANLEYRYSPFYQGRAVNLSWGFGLGLDADHDYFVGAGLIAEWPLRQNWFVEFSLMPSYYEADKYENRLGGDLQFRALLALGRTLRSGDAVSLALAHASNASLNEFNPGVNSLLARYHVRF